MPKGQLFKLLACLKLTNTELFAAWLDVAGDATPDGLKCFLGRQVRVPKQGGGSPAGGVVDLCVAASKVPTRNPQPEIPKP